jgi:hypothetical protein
MHLHHTVLLSTISTIAFLRGFFRESNFNDSSSIALADEEHRRDPRVRFKLLKRGVSSEADSLLDYLVRSLSLLQGQISLR